MTPCIVRFAPSPSGYLHIGGARTAIFNWLFARKHGGKFILRIEDTDAERTSEASVQGILDGLQWLGIDWDAGPFFQSDFKADHLVAAQKLIDGGHAYKCFCSKEALESKREAAQRNKTTYQYDGSCRDLSAQVVQEKQAAGLEYVIRLKVPRGAGMVAFHDQVRGRVEKSLQDIEDFVLVRANGQPLYVLANAVDDIRDGITHVIRGQDGLANTPKQVLIYQGLAAPLPVFAHMSLTLDPQKAKISKRRHGDHVAIHYYREQGFLPWAMVNFLVLLGWSTSDSREFFDPPALIEAFCLEAISRTNSMFNIHPEDPKFFTDPKLLNTNAHYLRTMPVEELLPYVKEQLIRARMWDPAFESDRRQWFMQTVSLVRSRAHVLTEFVTLGAPYFSETFSVDDSAVRKNLLENASVRDWMPALAVELEGSQPFEHDTVEALVRSFLARWKLKPGQLINAVRTALTGQAVGPEFIQVLLCLGRQRVVSRLHKACTMIEAGRADGHGRGAT